MSSRFLDALSDPPSVEGIRTKLTRIAWHRYRIRATDAEDVVQGTFATYLEVRQRYGDAEDHRAILLGIFRKKCLEHIDRSVRSVRRFRKYCTNVDAARENPWIRPSAPAQTPSVLDDLVRRDARREILRAIANLGPSSRDLVGLITHKKMNRQEMIRFLQVNKNTLDSRLHLARRELREVLRRLERGDVPDRARAKTKAPRVRAPIQKLA